jgi:hypothetical protein
VQKIASQVAGFVLTVAILIPAGCNQSSNGSGSGPDPEPLRVRRADGTTETITFAQAMAWHHAHEKPHGEHAAAKQAALSEHENAQEADGICAGVATGYQAIRYAAAALFPDAVPDAGDLELSAAGPMPGLWDMLELYAGRDLERPRGRGGALSLDLFTFTARRPSTGDTLSFRLREGLIPPEFFALKNQGLSCDHADVRRLKEQAARTILSRPPEACFERLEGPMQEARR